MAAAGCLVGAAILAGMLGAAPVNTKHMVTGLMRLMVGIHCLQLLHTSRAVTAGACAAGLAPHRRAAEAVCKVTSHDAVQFLFMSRHDVAARSSAAGPPAAACCAHLHAVIDISDTAPQRVLAPQMGSFLSPAWTAALCAGMVQNCARLPVSQPVQVAVQCRFRVAEQVCIMFDAAAAASHQWCC